MHEQTGHHGNDRCERGIRARTNRPVRRLHRPCEPFRRSTRALYALTIRGHVADSARHPLADVDVITSCTDPSTRCEQRVNSDANGAFSIDSKDSLPDTTWDPSNFAADAVTRTI